MNDLTTPEIKSLAATFVRDLVAAVEGEERGPRLRRKSADWAKDPSHHAPAGEHGGQFTSSGSSAAKPKDRLRKKPTKEAASGSKLSRDEHGKWDGMAVGDEVNWTVGKKTATGWKIVSLGGPETRHRVTLTRDGVTSSADPANLSPASAKTPAAPTATAQPASTSQSDGITVQTHSSAKYGDVSPKVVEEVQGAIKKLPKPLLDALKKHGVSVSVFKIISDAPNKKSEFGVAQYNRHAKQVCVAEYTPYKTPTKDIDRVVLHELGHALDDALGSKSSEELSKISRSEYDSIKEYREKEDSGYYFERFRETFAEAVAHLYSSAPTTFAMSREKAEKNFPKTISFVRKLLEDIGEEKGSHTKSLDNGAALPAMSVTDQTTGGAFVPPPSFGTPHERRRRLRWRRPAAELSEGMATKGWITLSNKDKEGDKHGSVHVFIDGSGKISKGPAALEGKKPADLSETHAIAAVHGDKHPVTGEAGPKEAAKPAASKPTAPPEDDDVLDIDEADVEEPAAAKPTATKPSVAKPPSDDDDVLDIDEADVDEPPPAKPSPGKATPTHAIGDVLEALDGTPPEVALKHEAVLKEVLGTLKEKHPAATMNDLKNALMELAENEEDEDDEEDDFDGEDEEDEDEATLASEKPGKKLPHQGPDKNNVPNTHLPDESRPHLNAAEFKAIEKYSSYAYDKLNEALRTGRPLTDPDLQGVHDTLQAAFAKAKPLPKPILVSRGMTVDKAGLKAFAAKMESAAANGASAELGGYYSTSTSGVPDGFRGNVEFKIMAKRGLDLKPYSALPTEDEFLLDSTSEFKPTRVERLGDNKVIVHMEQV